MIGAASVSAERFALLDPRDKNIAQLKDIIKLGLSKEISQRVNNVSLSKSPSDSFNSRGLLDIGKEQDGYIKIGFETIERHEALLEQIIRKQFGKN